MPGTLLHIYGPITIHSFGLFVSIGFLLFYTLFNRQIQKKNIFSADTMPAFISLSVGAALLGGRLLFFINNLSDMHHLFNLNNSGFSLFGSMVATFLTMAIFLHFHKISIPIVLDNVALYFPLAISIVRIGCFFAGCCYGCATNVLWSVLYTQKDSLAPLHIALHPTQLYSAFLLFCIFLLMQYIYTQYHRIPGASITACLILMSLERGFIDLYRGNRKFITAAGTFISLHQIIALLLILNTGIIFLYYTHKKNTVAHNL